MKAGGGRSKGNSFERHVAKLVVTAFDCLGITQEDCYRTPSSGGHKYAKKEDPGDLVISKKLHKYFPFHIEAKHYRKVSLNALFTPIEKQKRAWKFKGWVEQVNAASRKGMHPVIVFKENSGPVLALLPQIMPLAARVGIRFRTKYKGETWYVMEFAAMLRELVREAKEQ